MQVHQLILKLKAHGITVQLMNDQLKLSMQKGALTEALRAEIMGNKAQLIEALRQTSVYKQSDVIPVLPPSETYELSPSQRRVWIMDMLQDNRAAYNLPFGYLLTGKVNVEAFIGALRCLVTRHEILRTAFVTVNGEPRQKVLPMCDEMFVMKYYEKPDEDPQGDWVLNQLEREGYLPFDLSKGPMLRMHLCRIKEDKYLFFGTFHHIITDGWSRSVIIRDLGHYYNSSCNITTNSLPPLRIQYKEYAAWRNAHLTGELHDYHFDYWSKKLTGAPMLELPTDRERSQGRISRGGSRFFAINENLTKGLNDLCLACNSSLFMGLTAMLNGLLCRYSGQEDILTGTLVAGRDNVDVAPLVGMFVNILPFRMQIDPVMSFIEILRMTRSEVLQSFEHQNYPFDQLVDKLKVERVAGRPILFNVLIVLQNMLRTQGDLDMNGLKVASLDTGVSLSEYDITFDCVEDNGTIGVSVYYNSDIFSAQRIVLLAGHFQSILASALQQPTAPLGSLDYLGQDDDVIITSASNHVPVQNKTIDKLFLESAEKWPDRVAVSYGDIHITYRLLKEMSSRVAARLVSDFGIERGDAVGLSTDRNEWTIIAMMGILMTGASYVPIDRDYPAERRRFIKEQSGLKMVAGDGTSSVLDSNDFDVTSVLSDNTSLVPLHHATDSDVAYIIYTSGSMGRPKGVEITHRSVHNLAQSLQSDIFENRPIRMLAVTTISFDISVLELIFPLLSGGTVIMLDRQTILNPLRLINSIRCDKPDVIQSTPSLWKIVVENGWEGDNDITILCGGEKMEQKICGELLSRCGSLYNMYGPTETTIWSTFKRITTANEYMSIGKPIDNTDLLLLDKLGNPVGVGIQGEIYIGGTGLARGYRLRPDLTAQQFVVIPVHENERFYKTGDIGRWKTNGEIEIIGRADRQVKIRGNRIELTEIEYILKSIAGIINSVVVVKKVGEQDELIAYYVSDHALDRAVFLNYLRPTLPSVMIPAFFVRIDSIPLTFNGKVNMAALPDVEEISRPIEIIPPSNEYEHSIFKAWSEILGINPAGVTISFFDLGGNSIKAIRLWNRLEELFPGAIEPALLFTFDTIATQASYIRSNLNYFIGEMKLDAFSAPDRAREDIPNVYFLPPFGGISIIYSKLAVQMKDKVNSYLMSYPGLFDEQSFESIENIVSHYCNYILSTIGARRSVLLFGYSSGGVLAYEIARSLEDAGYIIVLFLVDSAPKTFINTNNDEEINDSIRLLKKIMPAGENSDQFIERYLKVMTRFSTAWSGFKTTGFTMAETTMIDRPVEEDGSTPWNVFLNGPIDKLYLLKGEHTQIFSLKTNIDLIVRVVDEKLVSARRTVPL